MRAKIKKKFPIFVIVFLFLAFFALSVQALEIRYPRMPGMNETPAECLQLDPEERLGCYIKYLYHFSLTISGFVCIAAIVSGGFLHLIAGPSVAMLKEGKERIFIGFLGMILLFSSYMLLNFLNPQMLILSLKAPEIADVPPLEIPPYVGELDAYIEIPLGRLMERVKIVADVANYWSWQTWYEGAEDTMTNHTSLKELTDCLRTLTDECDCADILTTNCPPGQCTGDPCNKPRVTDCQGITLSANLRDAINEVNAMIPEKETDFQEVIDTTEEAKAALEYANSRLKLGEALVRAARGAILNYDSFIGIEEKKVVKLWIYEDVPIAITEDPSGLPVPPQECSADAPYEIVPSCTICAGANDNVLRCYGNAFRLCETDPIIPPSTQGGINIHFDAGDFPSGYILYNGVVFPVPIGGVELCDANVYGCVCPGQSLSEPEDDPATFYIQEKGNEDIIDEMRNLLASPPPTIPPGDPLPPEDGNPYPPGTPPPVTHDLQQIAMWVQEQTGVRASLILALLYHESGLAQFPGSGSYPGSFCCNRSNWWKINNCDKFEKIWIGLTGSVNGIYSGTRLDGTPFSYTIYTVPVSAAGYIGGVYNCGGAMGPAQAMAFTWLSYAPEVKLITGKTAISPWNYTDAFVFAALHLKHRGGADSQKCADEKKAVCNYWGDTGCRNYGNYATSVLQRANGIAQEKTNLGKTGWTQCNGGVTPPPPGGEWQWPIRGNTVLSSNAQDHLNRGSVCAWDFTAECGREIYPAKPGRVVYAGCNNAGGYGCWVWIDHGAGWKTYYCHLNGASNVFVSSGQYVTKGTVLGRVGCTGTTSFGPHTHFEVFGPSATYGCKGRVDPKEIFGHPDAIGLPYRKFCRSGACPSCSNPQGYCW